MSIAPLITFKAGVCDLDTSSKPYKVKPQDTPGYIYLYSEDELVHFCWRSRDAPLDEPQQDLIMVPGDGNFVPYDTKTPSESSSKTNGRIVALKFTSSSQRYLYWLQSKPQGRSGDPAWFSPRDRKICDIVDRLLQGENPDVNRELASVRNNNDDSSRRDGDDDETMEDVEGHGDPNDHHGDSTGGAGADATGGDVRREGEDAREGGADGARAASANANADAAAIVQSFLESLKGTPLDGGRSQAQGKLYPLLNDLLETPVTIPMLEASSDEYVDNLLNFLPPTVLVLAQGGPNASEIEAEPSSESVTAAREAMTSEQKRALLKNVLRSPQFNQSLSSLTAALRDGGLPSISEALGIAVENGGHVQGGTVPLGGGDAIEAFVEGVKKTVQKN
ncbi:proteasome complex subunit Rpn13 ubiquitin receptor-domain-containing protein [Apodospora peruviana]|uniref:Proteasome complex subunit Rpn13 ubiquitin receptor-domain-containing protein n=1 Tax=Apodospora peruviana TaxID=516989 RepID=A0AAE0IR37_9PEZI|nr:proteasome complex subunit Rpn13 ubiquitin receptor-domain-containing protein [Apodospora peruviana]